MNLYENIKFRRVELGLTQSELAAKVGYSDKGMISKVENGKVDLSQTQVVKFAQALETTPAALMGWDDRALNSIPHKYHNPLLAGVNVDIPNSAHTATVHYEENRRIDSVIDYAHIISTLLGNKQIVRLMLAAQHADPDQIEMAINLLNYKKENK